MASRTKLREAVRDLRARDVAALLRETPDLLAWRDERGRDLLHVCCGVNAGERGIPERESVRTADVLLAAGLELNREAFREGSWRATPLWYAVARGHNVTLAKHLLRRGADPNHCLRAAGFNDDVAAIRRLIAHGADPDFRDSRGMTALHYMLKKSSAPEHFATLLRHGARGDIPNADGETAAALLARKRDPRFRRMVAELAT